MPGRTLLVGGGIQQTPERKVRIRGLGPGAVCAFATHLSKDMKQKKNMLHPHKKTATWWQIKRSKITIEHPALWGDHFARENSE